MPLLVFSLADSTLIVLGFSWVAIAQLFQSQATLLNLGGRIRDGESGCGAWPEVIERYRKPTT